MSIMQTIETILLGEQSIEKFLMQQINFFIDLFFIIITFVIAYIFRAYIEKRIQKHPIKIFQSDKLDYDLIVKLFLQFSFSFIALTLLTIFTIILEATNLSSFILSMTNKALIIYSITSFIFLLIDKKRNILSIVITILFMINDLGYTTTFNSYLKLYSISLGSYSISALMIIRSIIAILFFIFFSKNLIKANDRWIDKAFSAEKTNARTNNKNILLKLSHTLIYFFLALIFINYVGFDIRTIMVIGGALSVGIGFGLSSITSNFISGIIMLFEKNVKINDYVELSDGSSGIVSCLGIRSTIIQGFDNKKIIVPNENLMSNNVTNWTLNDNKARITFDIAVHYGVDYEQVINIILESLKSVDNILDTPKPMCCLKSLTSDSAVNFMVFFWIDDILEIGMFQPKSDALVSIWKNLKLNGISIPRPESRMQII